jgi:hypothetical protein
MAKKTTASQTEHVKTERVKSKTQVTQSKNPQKTPKTVEEQFYIGLTNPAQKRRILLELTADHLRLLKHIEVHKARRAEKKAIFQEYHKVMNEIKVLTQTIYNQLPKQNIPHKHTHTDAKKQNATTKPAPVDVPKARPRSELETLESELASIEKKLQTLQ